jgi:hypothetical protein
MTVLRNGGWSDLMMPRWAKERQTKNQAGQAKKSEEKKFKSKLHKITNFGRMEVS